MGDVYRATINKNREAAEIHYAHCAEAYDLLMDKTTKYARDLNACAELAQKVSIFYNNQPDDID